MFKIPVRTPAVLMAALILIPGVAASQSVRITPKKVIYKRLGKDVPDYKRTFEVRYPVFSGKLSAPALRNLKRNTDYWPLFEINLSENLTDDDWLSSLGYQVKYNNKNLLAIWLSEEGSGAYPDSITKYLVIDLRNGNVLTIEDLFKTNQLTSLRNVIRQKMKSQKGALNKERKDELKEIRKMSPELYPLPTKLELKNLSGFSISDRGVTFIYSYDYPHAAKAFEPSGAFFVPYSQLRPFIRNDGLLARFVR